MSNPLRTLHDQLLALKPDDAAHVASDCDICQNGDLEIASTTSTGGSVTDTKTYTEAEYNEAVAKVEALEAQVAEMSSAAENSEIESRVKEATSGAEAQVAEIQIKLDAATLEAETAKKAHEDLVAKIESDEKAAEEATAFEALQTERVAQVKEAAPLLPDEYVTENAARFAQMDEEVFAASLEGFKAISAKAPASTKEIPNHTAFTAARSEGDEPNPVRDVLSLRSMGVDTRTIN